MHGFSTQLTTKSRLPTLDLDDFVFGEIFSDHMFCMDYKEGVWGEGDILPYGPIAVEPGAMVLHYAQMAFEGLKAYRGDDNVLRLFRADRNARRLRASCERMCIPAIDEDLFVEAIKRLVQIDRGWVPDRPGYALYIRPLVFGTEPHLEVRPSQAFRFIVLTCPVGSYFASDRSGLSLKVEENFARTAPNGGVGECKTAANYATTFQSGSQSRAEGFDQVLWLDGADHRYIEEAGLANVFFKIDGTVVTPDLNGAILPGVTRDSVIALLHDREIPVEERRVTIEEVAQAARQGTLEEIFATGTAASVAPVASLTFRSEMLVPSADLPGEVTEQLLDQLTGIQYGRLPDPHQWTQTIEVN
jgi:branched-chain amino acid aminotransferase